MKIDKLGIPIFNKCDQCIHSFHCEKVSAVNSTCNSEDRDIKYKLDRNAKEKNELIRESAIQRLVKSLKVTHANQLCFSRTGLVYNPKSNNVRMVNSRGGMSIHTKKINEWIRYCENCGGEIRTVNETRRLCNRCHDEICERLGIDYSSTPMWSSKKAISEKDIDIEGNEKKENAKMKVRTKKEKKPITNIRKPNGKTVNNRKGAKRK